MSIVQIVRAVSTWLRRTAVSGLDRFGGVRTLPLRRSAGQSTAEYALVLLGAATVALVFIAWAGKTSRIGSLFNAVLDTVIGKV